MTGVRWWTAALLALAGCQKPVTGPSPGASAALPPQTVTLSGSLVEGVFTDALGDFAMRVPEGWEARPARAQDARRVTLDLQVPPVRIEVFRRPGASLGLPQHSTCTWRFSETELRPLFPATSEVTAAACTPAVFGGPDRLSWLVEVDGWQWELAALVGPSDLVAGLEAAEAVLATARWP